MQIGIRKLRLQRNVLLVVVGMLLISQLVLAVVLYRQDVVTRLVPTLTEEQLIGTRTVNDAALKARAQQVIYLLFSMHKENVEAVTSALLKQVDHSSYDAFKEQIEALAADIQQRNYRYVFADTQGYVCDTEQLTVTIQGYLETYLAGKQLESQFKQYRVSFVNRGGVLTLQHFEEAAHETRR